MAATSGPRTKWRKWDFRFLGVGWLMLHVVTTAAATAQSLAQGETTSESGLDPRSHCYYIVQNDNLQTVSGACCFLVRWTWHIAHEKTLSADTFETYITCLEHA